jgi:hypothetical protein
MIIRKQDYSLIGSANQISDNVPHSHSVGGLGISGESSALMNRIHNIRSSGLFQEIKLPNNGSVGPVLSKILTINVSLQNDRRGCGNSLGFHGIRKANVTGNGRYEVGLAV